MPCLGTSYTSYFNRCHKRRGTLFEGRYKSYLIDNETCLPEVTRYIHRNYFQPGLSANKRRDYPWSSYRIYLGRKASDLVETGAVLGRFGHALSEQRKRYQEFVEEGYRSENVGQYNRHMANKPDFAEKTYFQRQSAQISKHKESPRRVAVRILREVSLSLSLTANEMGVLRGSRSRALARHVAMYLIRKQTSLPLRSIGDLLGVKAPAVALGIGKVERLLKQEHFFKKIESLLENNPFSSSERAEEYSALKKELPDGSAIA